MKVTVGMQEAKAKLSELVERAQNGDEVVITKRGEPVVTLQPMKPRVPEFGFLPGPIVSDFTEGVDEEDLKYWYGE
jgi:prevent-host-death family protein